MNMVCRPSQKYALVRYLGINQTVPAFSNYNLKFLWT